jgi:hypothetical protein
MSKNRDSKERWQGNRRRDGVTVAEGLDSQWFVMTSEAGEVMSICPCCEKSFLTAKEARRVADLVYPTPEDARGQVQRDALFARGEP